jgi:DNA-directed RNA polymerase subunit RPC12/RpoP
MRNSVEKKCPQCGQRLRFPTNIGGMLMACPACGTRFYSDFKLGGVHQTAGQDKGITIFEMPSSLLRRIVRFFSL